MRKTTTYNSDVALRHAHFRDKELPIILRITQDFIAEHPGTKECDSFDNLANDLMRAGLRIKTIIGTNPINK